MVIFRRWQHHRNKPPALRPINQHLHINIVLRQGSKIVIAEHWIKFPLHKLCIRQAQAEANDCLNVPEYGAFGIRLQLVKDANLYLSGLPKERFGGVKIERTDGYFQDMDFCQGIFLFGTKWAPDLLASLAIADRFSVGFKLDYNDSMTYLQGQANYIEGKLIDTRLNNEDFKMINYIKHEDVHKYQGKQYRNFDTVATV